MSHVTTVPRMAASTAVSQAPDDNEAARLPKPAVAPLAGGGRILPIIPQSLAEVRQLADIIARSGAAPKSYRADDGAGPVDVDMVCAAILVGLEVGLAPMAALTGIVMLDDGPVIWGDARDGLVAASGLLVDMKEELVVDDAGIFTSAKCTVWRKDRPTPIEQTVTRQQAALAGWLENDVWKTNPNRMAQMRAKGWANRDAFPDVLKGLRAYDEEKDIIDVTGKGSVSTTPPPPRRSDFVENQQTPAKDAVPADAAQPQADLEPVDDAVGYDDWPLCDETGETIGAFPPARWFEAFENLTAKLEGPGLVAAMDNNRAAGLRIAADHRAELGPIIAETLEAVFVMTEDDEPPPSPPKVVPRAAENLCPEGETQEETACLVADMITAATTVARVNLIMRSNVGRMKSWRRVNSDHVTVAVDTRLEYLQMGGFPR